MKKVGASGLLPAGLRDGLPPEAEWEAHVIERLMMGFAGHGYRRVKPPLIEFEDTLLAGPGQSLAPHMFRLMDPISQRMLGVRPDMTLQVARIAETRLKDVARPLRLSYAGQVLRVRGSQLRPERQFAQAGAEIIGTEALGADLEVILMAAEALSELGVRHVSVDLTQPLLAPALCQGLGLDEERAREARRALDQKDVAALRQAAGPAAPTLEALMAAAGPAEQAVAQLARLPLPPAAADMAAELSELIGRLRRAAPDLMLTADPGEFRGLEYQTGISFTFFARGVRGELGRGGRYLSGGESCTGITLYLDSILRALPPANGMRRIYLPPDCPLAKARRLRAEGWCTVQGFGPVDDPAGEARRLGCTHHLVGGEIREVGLA
ncbi:MAG: ATP phosphoribosyltransferase regulatory subunit [Alphaproteobacteria bacterium]|nr:ATP phosphoribosyltransferase regulatory subunit [Alphaproteobacteria bacterium]